MREISPQELKRKIELSNPHWITGTVELEVSKYRKRDYFSLFYPLVKKSSVHRAAILMGPRRVGKTILLQHTIQQLIIDGIDPKKILYLSIDTPLLQGLALDRLLSLFLEILKLPTPEGCFVFFDEIQYLANWEVHLKSLVDEHQKTRFVGSGSAAASLKRKSLESGAGRFTDFILPPITFYEFLRLQNKEDQAVADIPKLNEQFLRYINFGGYPEAIFNQEIQQNPERFVRSDIIEKALLRDLPSLYGIQDIQELMRLFNTLAYQTGNEVTLDALSKSSGVAKNTIKRYMEYLESAFLIKVVSRIDESGKAFKRENYFKVYLTNPSMYSALFEPLRINSEAIGNLVETAIFSQLMHDLPRDDKYVYARWGGRKPGEVDLVELDARFQVLLALEVKWSDRYFEDPSELKSLIHFCQTSSLHKAAVTTIGIEGKKELCSDVHATFVPAAKLCYLLGKNIIEHKHATAQILAD